MKWSFLSLIFFMNMAFALTNPGPDGVRFNKLEIYKAQKTLHNQLTQKDLTLHEARELAGLQTILKTGKRAVDWFELVNSSRTPETRLDLSKKGSSSGMPIITPNKTNSSILIERYHKILKDIPVSISSVVTDSSDLPTNAPIADEDFIKAIRSLDVLYQHTIRWIGAKDSLDWYIERSLWDVRGYLFLKQIPHLQDKLTNYALLPAEEKAQLSTWLSSLCHNGEFNKRDCQNQLQKAVSTNRLWDYYNKFEQYGEAQYKSFFSIPAIRPEIYWNKNKTILTSPFLGQGRADIEKWLAANVQEEWQGKWQEENFQLKLDFVTSSEPPIPHIEFKSGVTAHVNDIAGDTITMDGDYSLQNYDQRWTIRHEYGHILGLVDCYLEFYDLNEKAMIYYEIDIDNLMCSRHGTFQPLHVSALKKAYK